MSAREQYISLRCTFDGCSETSSVGYANARERGEAAERRKVWRCMRHRHDGLDVLSAERLSLTTTTSVIAKDYGQFWDTRAGIERGLGFQAWAKDFPPGTVLTVTASVSFPDETP